MKIQSIFYAETYTMRHQIASVTNHKHVAHVGVSVIRKQHCKRSPFADTSQSSDHSLRESRRNHPRIHASEEDGLRLRIVADPLELFDHLQPRRVTISHDTAQYSLHSYGDS